MSEVSNESKNQERIPYKATIEPMPFTAEFEGNHTTSNEFCLTANEYFREVFADFHGSTFDIVNGAPTLSLYFDHPHVEEGKHYGVERLSGKTVGNSVIDKTRNRDRQLREGDRYHITEDGKDIITPLLIPRLYNQGKVNWGNIVSDIIDNTAATYYQPQQNIKHLTKIIGIDPRAVLTIFHGGNPNDYSVEVKTDLSRTMGMMMQGNSNYMLAITKASLENIKKAYEKMGLGSVGSSIIR